MRRYIVWFLALILSIIPLLSSCGNKQATLSVVSLDYPELGELYAKPLDCITEEKLREFEYCYELPSYHVYLEKLKLVVSDFYTGDRFQVCDGSDGYYLGMNFYDFATGIIYKKASGYEDKEPRRVLDGRCVAFLKPEDAEMSYCYAVTGYDSYDSEKQLAIYKLGFVPEQTAEKIIDIPNYQDALSAVITEDNKIFVLTSDSLMLVDDTFAITKIDMPDYWRLLYFNSMVYLDQYLYIGTRYGILQYDVTAEMFTWYPIHEDFM